MSKQLFVKFGLQVLEHGGFGLIAQNEEQARMLAEIASIKSDRISSFGPVTKDDSLTSVVWIESRKQEKIFNRKFPQKSTKRPKSSGPGGRKGQ